MLSNFLGLLLHALVSKTSLKETPVAHIIQQTINKLISRERVFIPHPFPLQPVLCQL